MLIWLSYIRKPFPLQYVETLATLLSDLKQSPGSISNDTIEAYEQEVKFLQGIVEAEQKVQQPA